MEEEYKKLYWKVIELIDSVKSDSVKQKEHFNKASEGLTEARLRIISHFDDFEKITQHTQETLERSIEGIVNKIAQESAARFNQVAQDTTSDALNKIYDASSKSSALIEQMKENWSRKQVIIVLAFCCGSLITSGLLTWIALKNHEPALSPQMVRACRVGLRLQDTWPKLSKKEQDKLNKLMQI